MPPLEIQVGFTIANKAHPKGWQKQLEFHAREALWSDIQNLQRARACFSFDIFDLRLVKRTVEVRGINAVCSERIYLIFHERDEWRDHKSEPFKHKRGQLKTQRFPATRRHEDERIFLFKNV